MQQTMDGGRFAAAVRGLERIAFAVSFLILQNGADCEDAIGAAVLSAYEKRGQLRHPEHFRAWFLRIVRNECYGILRAKRRLTPLSMEEEAAPDAQPALRLDLAAALSRLPESQRVALLLQQEGYRLEEIAAILEVPAGTVKSRIFRARNALRKELEEEAL